jgi:hypothetical protein
MSYTSRQVKLSRAIHLHGRVGAGRSDSPFSAGRRSLGQDAALGGRRNWDDVTDDVLGLQLSPTLANTSHLRGYEIPIALQQRNTTCLCSTYL